MNHLINSVQLTGIPQSLKSDNFFGRTISFDIPKQSLFTPTFFSFSFPVRVSDKVSNRIQSSKGG